MQLSGQDCQESVVWLWTAVWKGTCTVSCLLSYNSGLVVGVLFGAAVYISEVSVNSQVFLQLLGCCEIMYGITVFCLLSCSQTVWSPTNILGMALRTTRLWRAGRASGRCRSRETGGWGLWFVYSLVDACFTRLGKGFSWLSYTLIAGHSYFLQPARLG